MEEELVHKKLVNIQREIDRRNVEASKQDFMAKTELYNGMKGMLDERDKMVSELAGFWQTVFVHSEVLDILYNDVILEDSAEQKDKESEDEYERTFLECEWIDSVRIEYRDSFKVFVEVRTRDNVFFDNPRLTKEFSYISSESLETTPIEWKGKKMLENPLLRFFSGDNDNNIPIFDMLCDIYVNAVYYYVKSDERMELFDEVEDS